MAAGAVSRGSLKDGGDFLAVLTGFSYWIVDWIPWIASFLGAIWLVIRIYEWARVRLFGKEPIDLKL